MSQQKDWERVRTDFPILHQKIGENALVYLDSAASTQIPQHVIDAFVHYQSTTHSNVHRGVHTLSQRATDAYEGARQRIADFIGAKSSKQCIFVRGATEGVNLVAHAFGSLRIGKGDEILLTELEHHSNIVPWQLLAQRSGAVIKVVPVTPDGNLDIAAFHTLLSQRTKIFACTHVSNVLGTVNPVATLARACRNNGTAILIDGCQAMLHTTVDMSDIDPDFYVFSGHKMCAPTGIGILYMKEQWLEELPPFMGGGDMISSVSFEKTEYNEPPYKFEAGTPPIVGAVTLGATVDYLTALGRSEILRREQELTRYFIEKAESTACFSIIGAPSERGGVFSFSVTDVHHHDIGTILDSEGVAVRVGQHCAEPLMDALQVTGTARASLAFYNSEADIEAFFSAIEVVRELCLGS